MSTVNLCLIFLIFNFIHQINGKQYTELIYKEHESERMSNCVSEVVRNSFPCGSRLTIVCVSEACSYTTIKEQCYPSLKRSYETKLWLLSTDVYIIVGNIHMLPFHISSLKNDPAWNPRAKFILVTFDCTYRDLREIFFFLGKLYIYNAVVFSIQDFNKTDTITTYTYNPFEEDVCGKNYFNTIELGKCNEITNKKLLVDIVPRSFNGCSFNVAGFEQIPHVIRPANNIYDDSGANVQGLEEYMLTLMGEIENITFSFQYYKNLPSGFVLPNYTTFGVLRYLHERKVDIVIGGYFLMENRANAFEFVWGYSYAKVLIITPAAKDMIWLKILLRGFSVTTWILVIVTYLFILLLIASLFSKKLGYRNGSILALKLADYFYGHADRRLFKITEIRSFLIVWIWFTFLVNNFYTTALCSFITSEIKEKSSFDSKNLHSIPFEPCVIEESIFFFSYIFNIDLPGKDRPECKSLSLALKTIADEQEMYTIDMDYSFALRAFRYFDEEGHPKLNYHTFTNVVLNFYLNRGFPLAGRFKRHASHIFESGLLTHHMTLLCLKRNCQYVYEKLKMSKKFHPLTFERFKYTFVVFCLSYIPIIIVFIVEVSNGKNNQ